MTTINPKVAAATLGGAIVTTGVGLADQYAGFSPSAAVVAGMTTIVVFALGWLVPESMWDRAPVDDGLLPEPDPETAGEDGVGTLPEDR